VFVPLLTFDRKRPSSLRQRLPGRLWVSPSGLYTSQCPQITDLVYSKCDGVAVPKPSNTRPTSSLVTSSSTPPSKFAAFLNAVPSPSAFAQPKPKDHNCGPAFGNKKCPNNLCCSDSGYCVSASFPTFKQSPDICRETPPSTAGSHRTARRILVDVTVTLSHLAGTLPRMHDPLSVASHMTSGSSIASKNVPLL